MPKATKSTARTTAAASRSTSAAGGSKKTSTSKAAAGKAAPKKAAPKKATASKAAPGKAPAGKSTAKKAAVGKTAARKTTAKKAAAGKTTTTRTAAKKKTAGRKAPGTTLIHGIAAYETRAGEEYMSPEQLEHFRRLLLAWKRELMEEVDRTVHHMQDEAANFPDPNDRATQESEFSLELRTRDRERKLIKKIDEALARLDTGEYGYCESCGVEIGIRRLEARPTATLCIDCKTLDEIRERQRM